MAGGLASCPCCCVPLRTARHRRSAADEQMIFRFSSVIFFWKIKKSPFPEKYNTFPVQYSLFRKLSFTPLSTLKKVKTDVIIFAERQKKSFCENYNIFPGGIRRC